MTAPTEVKHAAVLGAGTIGASWAAWFLARGIRVSVWDPRAEAEAYVRRYVAEAWPAMRRLGMLDGASPDDWSFRATAPQAVAEPDPSGGGRGGAADRRGHGGLVPGVLLAYRQAADPYP